MFEKAVREYMGTHGASAGILREALRTVLLEAGHEERLDMIREIIRLAKFGSHDNAVELLLGFESETRDIASHEFVKVARSRPDLSILGRILCEAD